MARSSLSRPPVSGLGSVQPVRQRSVLGADELEIDALLIEKVLMDVGFKLATPLFPDAQTVFVKVL